jgi:hypothetical protein
MKTNLTDAAALLATVDLDPYVERRDEIVAEKATISAARARRDEELGTLDREIRRLEANGPDGDAVADALLRGSPVAEVANVEVLRAERDKLRSAGKPLQELFDAARVAEEQARSAVLGELAPIGNDAVEADAAEIGETVLELAALFASNTAIARATGSPVARENAFRVSEVLAHCRSLAPGGGQPIAVPGETISMLEAGRAAIDLAGRSIMTSVAWPSL